jgi:hypothetical protein
MILNPFALGVPFVPTAIAGLLAWYKADALALADAASVSQWDDSSGSANHVVQATGANQPTYRANQLNGLPTIQFDGGDYLQKASFPLTSTYTLFTVVKTTGSGFMSVLDHDIDTPRIFLFRYNGASSFELSAWSSGGLATDSQAITGANYSIVAGVRRTLDVQVYVNGATNGLTASSGTPNTPGGHRFTVGGRGAANFLTGHVAEVLVYNSSLSDANRQSVQNYLGAKYGIAVS